MLISSIRVQERQREAAAGDQDALAAEAGAHQRDVARRLAVEAIEEQHREGQSPSAATAMPNSQAKDDHGPTSWRTPEN